MELKERLSPLAFCFRRKINPIFFKEYCNFYNIKEVSKLIQELRARGYTINGNVKQEIKVNPIKEFLSSLGVNRF